MPQQYHHMASHYGQWGERFQELIDEYGYPLSVADPARSWNVFQMPHRGPHPREYHEWVFANMERAAQTAGPGNTEEFKRLFDLWVVQPVLNDPTMVRLAYWKCYR